MAFTRYSPGATSAVTRNSRSSETCTIGSLTWISCDQSSFSCSCLRTIVVVISCSLKEGMLIQSRTLNIKRVIIFLNPASSWLGVSTHSKNYYYSQQPMSRRQRVPVTPLTIVGCDIAITLLFWPVQWILRCARTNMLRANWTCKSRL